MNVIWGGVARVVQDMRLGAIPMGVFCPSTVWLTACNACWGKNETNHQKFLFFDQRKEEVSLRKDYELAE